ncbi:MAG: hypothetical protein JSR61_06225 [Proteobacteria bacterium]|nr:hypothetical protein [Pseudomonadota bacterium]
MDQFIHRANLQHFRRLLEQTNDETRRRQLERFIAEEEAKDAPKPKPEE